MSALNGECYSEIEAIERSLISAEDLKSIFIIAFVVRIEKQFGGSYVISAEIEMGGRSPKNSIASVTTYFRCGRRSVGFGLAHLLLDLLEGYDVLLVLLLSDFD